ncbi:MAG: hypothetical protein LBO63_04550 [Oscillospiraceae bacterium]|jgi:hypothetical protein|nr:hypothetical protein [Oscillospiraceae bacterium]
MIFSAVLIFIILSVQPAFFTSRFRQRFEFGMPVCLCLDVFLLLLAGMLFHNLIIGLVLICVFSAASLALAVFFERKNLRSFFSEYLSPGFWAFLVLYALVWIVCAGRIINLWDEFMHWGPMVKQTYLTNRLFTDEGIQIIVHKDYTPAPTLLQYMFLKFSGQYSEGIAIAANSLSAVIFLLPVAGIFKKSEKLKGILAVTAVWLSLSLVIGISSFFNLYVDLVIGVFLGCAVLLILFNRDSKLRFFNVIAICVFIALYKGTGILFSLIAMGLYVLVELLEPKNKPRMTIQEALKPKKLIRAVISAVVFMLPVIVFVFWMKYGTRYVSFTMSEVGAGKQTILSWFTLNSTDTKLQIFLNFIKFCLSEDVSYSFWEISTVSFVAVSVTILAVFCFIEKDSAIKRRLIITTALLTAGFFAYTLSLLFVYYKGLESSSLALSSLPRYQDSYLTVFVILGFTFLLRFTSRAVVNKKAVRRGAAAAVIVLLVMLMPPNIFTLLFMPYEKVVSNRINMRGREIGTEVVQRIAGEHTRAYIAISEWDTTDKRIVDQVTHNASNESAYRVTAYNLIPIEVNSIPHKLGIEFPQNKITDFHNSREWGDYLLDQEYEYVFLYSITEYFLDTYHYMFECALEDILPTTLYRVVRTENPELPVMLQNVPIADYRYDLTIY